MPKSSRQQAITVLVDTREKMPLRFPSTLVFRPANLLQSHNADVKILKVITQSSCLSEYGCDYTILGMENVVRIERKGSPSEVWTNLSCRDSARQSRSFDRLVTGCTHPILLLDFPVSSMWKAAPVTGVDVDTSILLDRLLATRLAYNLELYWTGIQSHRPTARHRIGELALRLMLHHVTEYL